MRKKLMWVGIFLLSILIVIPVIISFNKNKVKSLIVNELNTNINGQVSVGDLDISIIKSFPYLGLEIQNVMIADPTSDTILNIDKFNLRLNLKKLIFSKLHNLEINQLILDKPRLFLKVDSSGTFNFSKIYKQKSHPEQNSYTLNLKLEKVLIKNGTFSHVDFSSDPFSVYLENINTKAFGKVNSNNLKLEFNNAFDQFTYISENITYLKQVKGTWEGDLIYMFDSGDWLINNIKIGLNTLKTKVNGDIQSGKGILKFDLDVHIPENTISDLISIIPGVMANQFDKLTATGKFSLVGSVKGMMDSIGHKPLITFKTILTNGNIKYNHLPYSLSSINLDLSFRSLDSFATRFQFNPSCSALLNNEPLSLNAVITYDNGNISNAKGIVKTHLQLEDIGKMVPINTILLGGIANVDLNFDFNESQVRQKQFDQMKLDGNLEGKHILVKLPGYPELNIEKIIANFSSTSVGINIENGKYGNSDLAGDADISNPIAFVTDHLHLTKVSLVSSSELLDINEITNWGCDTCLGSSQMSEFIPKLQILCNSKIRKIKYHDFNIENSDLSGSFIRDTLSIKQGTTSINGSKLRISGSLFNPYQWSFDKHKLNGKLKIESDLFDITPYLDTSTITSVSSTYEKMMPANTDLIIDFRSSSALYNQFRLSNLKINTTITNQNLNLESCNASFAGGNINLTGVFSETNMFPTFDLKLDLNQMKVDEALKNSRSFVKIAPIAAFFGGLFSTSSILQGSLDGNKNPVWSNFDAAGVLEVINGRLANFKPLEELSKKIQIPILKSINWEKSKNWFIIEKGMVKINPFIIPNKDIFIQLKGNHFIEQNIDYILTTGIPKKIFDQYKVNPYLNPDMTWMREELKAKGIPLQNIDTFYFETSIKGKLLNPITVTKWVSKPGGKTYSEQVKEDIEKALREKADSILQSIESKVENKKDSLLDQLKNTVNIKKDQLDSLKNVIQDSIKKMAEARTKEIMDSVIRKETTKVLDSTLQSKIDTLFTKNTKEEIEKINEKLKNWNPLKKKKKEN